MNKPFTQIKKNNEPNMVSWGAPSLTYISKFRYRSLHSTICCQPSKTDSLLYFEYQFYRISINTTLKKLLRGTHLSLETLDRGKGKETFPGHRHNSVLLVSK